MSGARATDVPGRAATLSDLCNVGPATLADLHLLGIDSVEALADEEADALYLRLCAVTGARHDPCMHDVFSAIIHEAKTGEARRWWAYSPERKARQARGEFPQVG